ncbi:Lsr2 family DNA-binding protein [Rhodococcus koreensis]
MAVSPRNSDGSAKNTSKAIREWAIREGREVSSRGRISAEVERAFHDAQSKKVRAKTAPVTAVASKTPVARAVVSKASAKKSSGEIRQWAIGAGLEVSSRGRISAKVERAFHDAQAKTDPAEPKKVNRTAAKKAIAETTTAKKRAIKTEVGDKASTNRAAASKAPTKTTTKGDRGGLGGVLPGPDFG